MTLNAARVTNALSFNVSHLLDLNGSVINLHLVVVVVGRLAQCHWMASLNQCALGSS